MRASHSKRSTATKLLIKEDLVAERIAIDSYREMLEGILAMEEEHADDLVGMLEDLEKQRSRAGAWRALRPGRDALARRNR